MTVEHPNAPTIEQLIDVVGNSSVGITITDRSGAVLLHNKAQSVLMHGEADHLGGRIRAAGRDVLPELLADLDENGRIENVRVTYLSADSTQERASAVNAVVAGAGDDTRIHWVSRRNSASGCRSPAPATRTPPPTLPPGSARSTNGATPSWPRPRNTSRCCASSTRSRRWPST